MQKTIYTWGTEFQKKCKNYQKNKDRWRNTKKKIASKAAEAKTSLKKAGTAARRAASKAGTAVRGFASTAATKLGESAQKGWNALRGKHGNWRDGFPADY